VKKSKVHIYESPYHECNLKLDFVYAIIMSHCWNLRHQSLLCQS